MYLIIVNWHRVVHKIAYDNQGLFSFGLQLVFGHLSFLCLLFQCYTFLLQLTGILLFLQMFAADIRWLWVAAILASDMIHGCKARQGKATTDAQQEWHEKQVWQQQALTFLFSPICLLSAFRCIFSVSMCEVAAVNQAVEAMNISSRGVASLGCHLLSIVGQAQLLHQRV